MSSNAEQYTEGLIATLQNKLGREQARTAQLEEENATLRSATVVIKNDLQTATQTLALREGRIRSLMDRIANDEVEIDTVQAISRAAQRDQAKAEHSLYQAQAEIDQLRNNIVRLDMLNREMKKQIESTPAPRKNLAYNHHPTMDITSAFSAYAANNSLVAYGGGGSQRGAPTIPTGPSSQMILANNSFRAPPSRPAMVVQGPPTRGQLPSFATPAVSRTVTIRRPSAAVSSPDKQLSPSIQPAITAFNAMINDIERCAEKWTASISTQIDLAAQQQELFSSFDSSNTIKQIWSSPTHRHALVSRYIIQDMIANLYSLRLWFSFPNAPTVTSRLAQIDATMRNQPALPIVQKGQLLREQASLLQGLFKNHEQVKSFTTAVTASLAEKTSTALGSALNSSPMARKDLQQLYAKAAHFPRFLFSQPCRWEYSWVRGGVENSFDADVHEVRNEELVGLPGTQIKEMGLKILFCQRPGVEREIFGLLGVEHGIVRGPGVIVSRDGVSLD